MPDGITFDGSKRISLGSLPCKAAFLSGKDKDEISRLSRDNLGEMLDFQEKLYAGKTEGLVILLQGMDASGKDGLVTHVLGGLNPQGVDVHAFKQPTPAELAHDYLWRIVPCLPERGKIAVFNRSYYEDVLVVRVHRLFESQNLPRRCTDGIFENRYGQIRDFERYLWENGIRVVKIFLHMSKDEQRKRLLERIRDTSKNWKFEKSDLDEREYWDAYRQAYEDAINATSTIFAPWHIIPADSKPQARYLASEVILDAFREINPRFPALTAEKAKQIAEGEKRLSDDK